MSQYKLPYGAIVVNVQDDEAYITMPPRDYWEHEDTRRKYETALRAVKHDICMLDPDKLVVLRFANYACNIGVVSEASHEMIALLSETQAEDVYTTFSNRIRLASV